MMRSHKFVLVACLCVAALLAGCGESAKSAPPKSQAPAKVGGPMLKEGELASVTLTPEAESRLGIRVAPVSTGRSSDVRRFAADVVLPPGQSVTVSAAVSGTLRAAGDLPAPGSEVAANQVIFELTPLVPLPRDLGVTAKADVEQARTRLETARLRKARADKMLKDEVGTVRAQEDAANELDLATSGLRAAQARLDQIERAPMEGDVRLSVRAPRDGVLRQLLAAPGQVVPGGAPLFEVADLKNLWLRVPVYSGEAALVGANASVEIGTLSGAPLGTARPVAAPPTADALAATVDLYYEIVKSSHTFKPGEKVSVSLPGRESRAWSTVPWPAIVFDIHGGAWVYEKAADHRYVRRRVQLDHTFAGIAYLASSPASGTPIVVEGVAELWGTEFGAGK